MRTVPSILRLRAASAGRTRHPNVYSMPDTRIDRPIAAPSQIALTTLQPLGLIPTAAAIVGSTDRSRSGRLMAPLLTGRPGQLPRQDGSSARQGGQEITFWDEGIVTSPSEDRAPGRGPSASADGVGLQRGCGLGEKRVLPGSLPRV